MTNKKELYSVRARGECGNEDLASNQAAGSVMDAENTVYTTTCSVMFVQNAINYKRGEKTMRLLYMSIMF